MRTSYAREQYVIPYSGLKCSYVYGIGTGPDLRVRACARSPGPGPFELVHVVAPVERKVLGSGAMGSNMSSAGEMSEQIHEMTSKLEKTKEKVKEKDQCIERHESHVRNKEEIIRKQEKVCKQKDEKIKEVKARLKTVEARERRNIEQIRHLREENDAKTRDLRVVMRDNERLVDELRPNHDVSVRLERELHKEEQVKEELEIREKIRKK